MRELGYSNRIKVVDTRFKCLGQLEIRLLDYVVKKVDKIESNHKRKGKHIKTKRKAVKTFFLPKKLLRPKKGFDA